MSRIDDLMREHLSKNEYRLYNVLMVLIALWLVYGWFDHSGPMAFFSYLQAKYLFRDSYYPVLSFVISFALFVIPLAWAFIAYAKWRNKRSA